MKKLILSIAAGAIALLGTQAKAHDYNDEDHISRVDHYRGADVIHYDHHHYYRDEYGNLVVVHHDHHYVVPHDDYRGDRDCDIAFRRALRSSGAPWFCAAPHRAPGI